MCILDVCCENICPGGKHTTYIFILFYYFYLRTIEVEGFTYFLTDIFLEAHIPFSCLIHFECILVIIL